MTRAPCREVVVESGLRCLRHASPPLVAWMARTAQEDWYWSRLPTGTTQETIYDNLTCPVYLALDLPGGQLFELWRLDNPSDEESTQDVAAIQQSLDAMAAGKMRPFSEFDTEFRTRHGITDDR